jgi:hypothetical protein
MATAAAQFWYVLFKDFFGYRPATFFRNARFPGFDRLRLTQPQAGIALTNIMCEGAAGSTCTNHDLTASEYAATAGNQPMKPPVRSCGSGSRCAIAKDARSVMRHVSWRAPTVLIVVCFHGRNSMQIQVLTHDAPAFRERPWLQPEEGSRQSEDEALYLRQTISLARETPVMTGVPMLDWPSDLFVDVSLELAV